VLTDNEYCVDIKIGFGIVTVICSHSWFVQTTSFVIFSCENYTPPPPPLPAITAHNFYSEEYPFVVPVIEQRLRISNNRDTKWNKLTSPEESFYGKLCTLPLGVCSCRVFVCGAAVVLLALAISRRPLQILEVRFLNGQLRLSFLSIFSQVLKRFFTHFLLVHAQFERSKRGQHYIVVPVPFAYTHPACCNHICFGHKFLDFWIFVLVPVVCPCLDYALQREAYSS
jgi:hypothetical protein